MTDALERLSIWYLAQCENDWYEDKGIKLDTLDNPGWRMTIDIALTRLQETTFARVEVDRSEHDWVRIWRTDKTFEFACGPLNLREAVESFLDWAEEQ